MKKYKEILEELEREEKSLNQFCYLNDVNPNEFMIGKMAMIKELRGFISRRTPASAEA